MSSATVIQCIHVQCRYCDVICTIYRVHSTLCVVIIMKLQPYLYCFCVHLPLTIPSLSWWIIYLHACTVFVHRPIIRRTIVDYCSLLRFVPNRWFVSSSHAPAKFWPRSRRESRRVFGRRDCRDLTEISARSRRDLKISAAINSPRFSPRSRRDLKISSRFSTRSWRDLKISAAKNPPRFSPRSRRDLKISAAKNSPRISTRFQVRS